MIPIKITVFDKVLHVYLGRGVSLCSRIRLRSFPESRLSIYTDISAQLTSLLPSHGLRSLGRAPFHSRRLEYSDHRHGSSGAAKKSSSITTKLTAMLMSSRRCDIRSRTKKTPFHPETEVPPNARPQESTTTSPPQPVA